MAPTDDSTHDPAHDSIDDLVALAHRAADAAARVTMTAFRSPLQVHDKSGGRGERVDPVTHADREAEQAIRAVLLAGAPAIGFVGEESSAGESATRAAEGSSSALRWVVDPIDGTRAFLAGMPVWGTLIALCDGQRAVFGLADVPVLGERYLGTATLASCIDARGTRRLTTRRHVRLADAVLCCTTPDMFRDAASQTAFERVASRVSVVRYGTDCYGYAMLAAGQVDLVVESDLGAWDVQALIPLVRGAGGVITDWQGGDPADGGSIVAAADPQLHAEAMSRLSGAA